MDGSDVTTAEMDRFRADLLALTGPAPGRIGVAVSGGPDSLALLLLAAAAMPGTVEAATVDHRLRMDSVSEAEAVAAVCAQRGVPHATLSLNWASPPAGNIQARAREARYHALGRWALGRGLSYVATAHHADDQAETILLRLARGSGLGGLAGSRRRRLLVADGDRLVRLVRPLLAWRRSDLAAVAGRAGLAPADDPANRDPRFDRTRARALLRDAPWLDARRLADAAHHLAEAEDALAWSARRLGEERETVHEDGTVSLDAIDLPPELQRRLLANAMARFVGDTPIPGPKLVRALTLLRAGRRCTLAGVLLTGGPAWRLAWAPPRRALPR